MPEGSLTIVGNIVKAPDLRFTEKGASVANFTIASTPRVLDKGTQQWKDGETLFMRCTAWRSLAENVADSLVSGTRVVATGRLKPRSWEKDGETKNVIELEVDEIGPSLRYAKVSTGPSSSASSNDPF